MSWQWLAGCPAQTEPPRLQKDPKWLARLLLHHAVELDVHVNMWEFGILNIARELYSMYAIVL